MAMLITTAPLSLLVPARGVSVIVPPLMALTNSPRVIGLLIRGLLRVRVCTASLVTPTRTLPRARAPPSAPAHAGAPPLPGTRDRAAGRAPGRHHPAPPPSRTAAPAGSGRRARGESWATRAGSDSRPGSWRVVPERVEVSDNPPRRRPLGQPR